VQVRGEHALSVSDSTAIAAMFAKTAVAEPRRRACEAGCVLRASRVHYSACAQRTVPPKALLQLIIRQKSTMAPRQSAFEYGPCEAIGESFSEIHLTRESRARARPRPPG
jgi:hypothetical protein